MKKNFLILFLIITLIIPNFISGVDIKLNKQEYFQKQTLLAEISGNFLDGLDIKNIGLYEENGYKEIPSVSELIKYQNKYFYYATLPNSPGNYSIQIKDTRYYEATTITNKTFTKSFLVSSSNTSYLSVFPGAIVTKSDITLSLIAYGPIKNYNIDFESYSESFELGEGLEKQIKIPINIINQSSLYELKIDDYLIPVIVYAEQTNNSKENNTITLEEGYELDFPSDFSLTLIKDQPYSFTFYIKNIGEKDIDLLEISKTSNLKSIDIFPKEFNDFLINEKITIGINISTNKEVQGNITLLFEDNNIDIPISIELTSNPAQVNLSQDDIIEKSKTCSGLGGKPCNKENNEVCRGIETFAQDTPDGSCCIGVCEKEEKSSSWIWGLIILILVIVIFIYLYKNAKKVKDSKKPDKEMDKRLKGFEDRFSPNRRIEPGPEISKGLSKS